MLILFYLTLTGLFAGLVGSIVGIGGGILIVPLLSIALKIPIKLAIGTSIVAVLGTSISASRQFFKKNVTNVPLGLTLEIPTIIGSIMGSFTIAYLGNRVVFIIFGIFTILSGISIYLKNQISTLKASSKNNKTLLLRNNLDDNSNNNDDGCGDSDGAGNDLHNDLHNNIDKDRANKKFHSGYDSEYFEETTNKRIKYRVKNIHYGSIASIFAGLFSGLLGVGGGIIKVPAMNIFMGVPIKVATATSNYMIGITAVVSSIIYFYNGYINPVITIPVVIGVLAGGTIGSLIASKLKGKNIVMFLIIIFLIIGIVMLLRAFNILNY
jgi:uncharacterized membrane protein YfcA